MKKKMLITLGCSYTEGVGCYEPHLLNDSGNIKQGVSTSTAYKLSLSRFHNQGWPAKLQKLIKYDHLINLGAGSASNLYTVKRLIEFLPYWNIPHITENYDVLVIWMMTHFGRYSMYRNGRLYNIGPSSISPDIDFLNSYLSLSSEKDLLLENLFALRTVQYICELNKFTFMYINADTQEGKLIDTYDTKISLNQHFLQQHPGVLGILHLDKKYQSFCHHPTELGYSIVAQRIFDTINVIHPELVNVTTPEKFTMEYKGAPQQW